MLSSTRGADLATITANAGFKLRMDASGTIPELDSYWSTVRSPLITADTFSTPLIKPGPFFTTYSIEVSGEFVTFQPRGHLTGFVSSLTLLRDGQSQLDVTVNPDLADSSESCFQVQNAARLPLTLFVYDNEASCG